MSSTDQLDIRLGLPERCRRQAAEIHYEAFRQKLSLTMGPQEQGISALEKCIDPELVLVAWYRNQVVGIAGLQYDGRRFLNPATSHLIRELGWLRGLFNVALLTFLPLPQRDGELRLNALSVRSSMRGQGIGTSLLQAVFDLARVNGSSLVQLNVVDTNPRARRLYERMGLVPARTWKCPWLRHAMGFSAVTTMIKRIGQDEEVSGCAMTSFHSQQ